jgi:benzoate-CoA ligase family protein
MPKDEEGIMGIPREFSMADYFLYDRLDEGLGNRVAVRTPGRGDWTYSQVATEANRFGNAALAGGLRPGERVLVSLHDVPEFAAAIFGTLRAGGVVAMVNPLLPEGDLAYFVEYTQCRVLACDREVAVKLRERVRSADFPRLSGVIVLGGEPPGGERFASYEEAVRPEAGRLEPHLTRSDDPAYWLFTSGTTGKPKAAMHRHGDFPWNCERYAKRVLGMKREDVTLSVPKLYFGYATGTNLFFPFSVGATTVLFEEKPTPDVLFGHIEKFRPTVLTSVPTSINQMVSDPDPARHDLSSLRCVLSAGEALPPELYSRWKKTFGVEIIDGIGSAETFHIYITNYPGDVTPGSLGRLVPGYEAKITDDEGRELGPGEIGRLWVRGGSVAMGYHEAPEKTRETFIDGWVRSADLFKRDDAGRFWYSGRADDMLKVSGIFVSPLEIEDVLLNHDAVAECCVVAYEDGGLQKPIALIVPKPGAPAGESMARELAALCKSRLAAYKFPRRVKFVDALPKNDRGKVERKSLRDELAMSGLEGTIDVGAGR